MGKRKILRGRAYNEDDTKEDALVKVPLQVRPSARLVTAVKNRKELRKEMRKAKKSQKHQYLLAKVGREDLVLKGLEAAGGKKKKKKKKRKKKGGEKKKEQEIKVEVKNEEEEESEEEEDEDDKFVREAVRNKLEKKETMDLAEELKLGEMEIKKEQDEARRKRLLEDNEEEERTINQLGKKLKLNKKAAIPASFRTDGLDFVLELCESSSKKKKNAVESSEEEDAGEGEEADSDLGSDFGLGEEDDDDSGEEEEVDDLNEDDEDVVELGEEEEDDASEVDSDQDPDSEEDSKPVKVKKSKKDKSEEAQEGDGVWEDIYGRLRGKDGSVLTGNSSDQVNTEPSAAPGAKYVPPALRGNQSKRDKLLKQLKGLLNRLSESNMHSISSQIEQMYMTSSRNEMNETVLDLFKSALLLPSVLPSRVVLEHVMLISILHANVGTEVGAFFTQSFVHQFKSKYDSAPQSDDSDDKSLENLVQIITAIYHFKIVDAALIFDILNFLHDRFSPLDVSLILCVLRSVGFRLRKDDPSALKALIVSLQQKASSTESPTAKVRFMLDILLAIRNNNVSKIPNYDPSFGDHLSKLLKSHLHPGNYVSTLKISLNDLLSASTTGRWWIVGSAWAGKDTSSNPSAITPQLNKDTEQHAKLLEKARAQGMNTDTRRAIFVILMTAEDYLDAFEKLNHLGLRTPQDREICHVTTYCSLQEAKYNPYYALILGRFCQDRKLMLATQFNIWDRLKDLGSLTPRQRTNLCRLLIDLINDKSLPISTIKVIEYAEMDKIKVKFLKRLLTGVLLQKDLENVQEIFVKVGMTEKLQVFRESLKLFLSHFMLQKEITTGEGEIVKCELGEADMQRLKERVKVAEKCMTLGKAGI